MSEKFTFYDDRVVLTENINEYIQNRNSFKSQFAKNEANAAITDNQINYVGDKTEDSNDCIQNLNSVKPQLENNAASTSISKSDLQINYVSDKTEDSDEYLLNLNSFKLQFEKKEASTSVNKTDFQINNVKNETEDPDEYSRKPNKPISRHISDKNNNWENMTSKSETETPETVQLNYDRDKIENSNDEYLRNLNNFRKQFPGSESRKTWQTQASQNKSQVNPIFDSFTTDSNFDLPKHLQISSKLVCAHQLQKQEFTLTVRPAFEYSLEKLSGKSGRFNDSFSFKCPIFVPENPLNIVSGLIRKHLLLLDFKDIIGKRLECSNEKIEQNLPKANFNCDLGYSSGEKVANNLRKLELSTPKALTNCDIEVPISSDVGISEILGVKERCVKGFNSFICMCEEHVKVIE